MFAKGPKVPLRILAADDDPSVLLSLTYALKDDGHNVRGVSDGRAALDELDLHPSDYDLLITDHAMEGMDGLTLVREVRGHGWQGPILVLSAVLDQMLTAAFNVHHVSQLIRKPFDLNEIRNAIRNAAAKKQSMN